MSEQATRQILCQGTRFDWVVGREEYVALVRERITAIAAYLNGRVLLRPVSNFRRLTAAGIEPLAVENAKVRIHFSDFGGKTIESIQDSGLFVFELEGGASGGPPIDPKKAGDDFESRFSGVTITDKAVIKMHCMAIISGTDKDAEIKFHMPMGAPGTYVS